jgi:hypothetical protein
VLWSHASLAVEKYPLTAVMVRESKDFLRKAAGGLVTNYPATAEPFRWLQDTDFKKPGNLKKLRLLWTAVKTKTLKLPGLNERRAAYAEHARETASSGSFWDALFSFSGSSAGGNPNQCRVMSTDTGAHYAFSSSPTYASPTVQSPRFSPTPPPASSEILGLGTISTVTGRIRDTAVSGYTRRDGTYVRPHATSR